MFTNFACDIVNRVMLRNFEVMCSKFNIRLEIMNGNGSL
jgi:hypothetical protein